MPEEWEKNNALNRVCWLAIDAVRNYTNTIINKILFHESEQKTRRISEDVLDEIKAIDMICTPLYEEKVRYKGLKDTFDRQMGEMYKGLKILEEFR